MLLGPVRAWRADDELDLGPPQQRAVLTLMLARVGRSTSLEDLIDLLWSHDPPRSAATVVHKYLGNLRRLFEPGLPSRDSGHWLVRHGSGYRAVMTDENLDLLAFRQFSEHARTAAGSGDHHEAVLSFVRGLDLWRDHCGADVPLEPHARRSLLDIDEEYLSVVRDAADSALADGDAGPALAYLRRAVEWAPLDEATHARLMAVLAATGRRVEALTVYQRIRQTLTDDLGIDPGPELREVHLRILREEPSTQPTHHAAPQPAHEPVSMVRPAQLPTSLRSFVGRREELSYLDSLLSGPATGTTVVVIDGMAGVGKTTLAVRWAATLAADRYPDGQLYVNMRGFDTDDAVVSTEQTLRDFLEALGVPQDRIPATVPAQAALYRSVLADQRVLIVLDNARDADQIRQLVPNSPACLVIVTSRNQLSGLSATHDARMLSLAPFSADEAQEALYRKLGAQGEGVESESVHEIALLCEGLPLAIAIVASRATTDRHLTLRDIAAELRDSRLDAFDQHDGATDIRAIFSWSYRLLSPDAARLFRFLAATGVPDLSTTAAASVIGKSVRSTRLLLIELVRARLLVEYARDRYNRHDLLAAYAAELTIEHDTEAERHAAVGRFLDHYVHSARLAHGLISQMFVLPAPEMLDDVSVADLKDATAAMEWYSRERHLLPTLARHALHSGYPERAWALALGTSQFYHRRGYPLDWAATHETALTAARKADDPLARAHVHRALAGPYTFLRRFEDALHELSRAAELFEGLSTNGADYQTERAAIEVSIATVHEHAGDFQKACEHSVRAVGLAQAAGFRLGEGLALLALGLNRSSLGDPGAIDSLNESMAVFEELGYVAGQASVLVNMGHCHLIEGDHRRAIDSLTRGMELSRQLGHPRGVTDCLLMLGRCHAALGNRADARAAFQEAVTMRREQAAPDVDEALRLLAELEESDRTTR